MVTKQPSSTAAASSAATAAVLCTTAGEYHRSGTTTDGKLARPHESSREKLVTLNEVSADCPFIDICIGDHQFRTLLDTGAKISLIDADFLELCDAKLVKPEKLTEKVTLISASGHKLKVVQQAKVRVTIGKVRMYHDFIVVKDLGRDMILGIDFLTARKARINFEDQTLIIGKSVLPLKHKYDSVENSVHLVRLAETINVCPRSDFQVKCAITKKKTPGEQFEISQLPSSPCFENEPGILMPNAIVKISKNRHIPWAIVNETGRFVTFKKGQVLGTATVYKHTKEIDISNIDATFQQPENHKNLSTAQEKIATFKLDHIEEPLKTDHIEALTRNLNVFVLNDKEFTVANAMEIEID
ncbi:MAG: retropepsin-like aspartic protease, partial [Cyanobacteria bacterium P01_F01_bin.86]